MRCKHCSFENPDGMKFCGQCAAPLVPVCTSCHFENPEGFKYCGNCGSPLGNTEQTSPSQRANTSQVVHSASASSDPPESYAERRQLTVLFCDVVGSAALSEVVDPEDLRDIMGDYRDTCQKVVQQFHGHIAQYLGDGILVYFGYPHANEDDASRAVQTGLELVRSIGRLNNQLSKERDVRLSIRVGIHTGLVVVGEIGSDDKRSLAMGTTPNVAARLQDLADPDTVLISDATHRLVQTQFTFNSLGEHKLKGFTHPFTLYQVKDIEPETKRFTAASYFDQIPLIGREQESALMIDRLEHAKSAQGQVVLLSGEAGIGKSRLVQLLREFVADDDNCIFECWGSPYHKHSFLHCVIGVLHNVLELDDLNNNEEKIKKLETPLASFGIPLSESVPLLAELLSVPVPEGRYPNIQTTPQLRKQKILEAIVGLVLGLASERMVVIIMEDLHWVDPTTIELLGMLIDQAPTSNVFILLSYRLEFTPPWSPRSHITQISINRLTRKQSGRMINWLANSKLIPVQVFNEIINKTDGTPFFVEELTKMVLESGLLKETHELYELAKPVSSLAIPSTLQDSLMARLDRLGPAKELAQLSATLGREFAHNILKAVADDAYSDMDKHLSQLVFHELLYQHGLPPAASYTFRHALVHEVAYQSLLKKTRQKYHRKIAEVLATQFPDNIQDNPEIMAHHCFEAGDYQSAAQYWSRAGRMAIQRSANADATVHLNNALRALEQLPESAKTAEAELQILAALGLANMLLKGYAADEVQSAYAQAYELSRHIGKSSKTFPILCGLWEFYLVRADLDAAQDLAVQLQTIASEMSKPDYSAEALRTLGATSFWRGDFTSAEHYLQRSLETSTGEVSADRMPVYGQDTEVAALSSLACVSWLMGFADRSLELINMALERAKQIDHPFSIVYATYFTAVVHQLRGDPHATHELAQQTIALSKKYEFSFWQDTAGMLSEWAQFHITGDKNHIISYEKILKNYVRSGSRLALSYLQTVLARMYIKANQLEEAETIIDKALNDLVKHSEHFFQVEILRLKAVVSWLLNDMPSHEIEIYFKEALFCAQRQSAGGLELRAALDYSRFLESQNQVQQASIVLGESLEKIQEGKTTQEYQQAAAQLNQLNNVNQQQEATETI